jgi:hypothetical protein
VAIPDDTPARSPDDTAASSAVRSLTSFCNWAWTSDTASAAIAREAALPGVFGATPEAGFRAGTGAGFGAGVGANGTVTGLVRGAVLAVRRSLLQQRHQLGADGLHVGLQLPEFGHVRGLGLRFLSDLVHQGDHLVQLGHDLGIGGLGGSRGDTRSTGGGVRGGAALPARPATREVQSPVLIRAEVVRVARITVFLPKCRAG